MLIGISEELIAFITRVHGAATQKTAMFLSIRWYAFHSSPFEHALSFLSHIINVTLDATRNT
jgi:hypothetical protein